MANSLRARVKKLWYEGYISANDRDRIRDALDKYDVAKKTHGYAVQLLGEKKYAYDCPSCKHCFTMLKPSELGTPLRNQFCDICGQAIDWSEEE